jgi:hypothetical protein
VPTAAIVLLAMLALGPPLGRALFPGGDARFWASIAFLAVPEPTEQARYLIAMTAPLLLTALTLRFMRRPLPLPDGAQARLATALEVGVVVTLAACLVLQRTAVFEPRYAQSPRVVYFTVASLAAAAALTSALAAITRRQQLTNRIARWTAESPARAGVAALIAVLAVAITVLPAIVPEASIERAGEDFFLHVRFTYDETAAVLDGRSPLGDFAAQYSSLWPYLIAPVLSLFDSSLGAFTVAMATLTGAAMLALFAVLRRVTRSAILALALFLPLLATSAFRLHGPSTAHFSLVNYFGTMPLRYAAPFLLAWLVARHLDGAWPRRAWPLFAAAGLVALNNADFGIPALGATLGALLWCESPTAARLRILALDLLLGLAAAIAAVTLLLLLRTGAPPDFTLLVRYARLFGVSGFAMVPIHPLLGVSTIVYLTYVGAIGTATVLTLRGTADRLLAGMLAWSGVFGLGVGSYYVGRSIAETLTNMFPAWGLAVALLVVVVVRGLLARPGRRPRAIELACLFAFGLLVCSLAQTPSPLAQAQRIASDGQPLLRHPAGEAFVAANVERGEAVVLLTALGHRIALNLGVDDVTPYTGNESIQTEEQLDDTLAALDDAGGSKVFLARGGFIPSGLHEALAARGLQQAGATPDGAFELWLTP